MESVLEELSATAVPEAREGEDHSSSDSDTDSETPKITLLEEDEHERAKLPEYTAKLKVGLLYVCMDCPQTPHWTLIHLTNDSLGGGKGACKVLMVS